MSSRKAFNFLRSYYDVLEDIYDDKDKLTYLMAILDKQFKGVEPELTGIPKLCYRGQKHSIDSSRKGWEDKVGYEPPTLTIDPTHTIGGSQGGSVEGLIGGIGHPTKHPSNNSVMTTEPPTEGVGVSPYLQEQEKGKEKEKEQEYNKLDFFEIDITEGVNDDLFEDWLKTKKVI
jgi:hypothetical protein